MSETYLVTGALGCIGAWVVKTIVDDGDTPVVFDLGGDPYRLEAVMDPRDRERVRFVTGDVTDAAAVAKAVGEAGATRIIHLAGLQVPFCKADPARGALVNVVGTLNVFQAARQHGIERVVYASSAAVYGPPADDAAPDENAPCEPATHYGVYKRANEGNARIFWQDDRLSSVGLRPLTVYGVGRDQGLTSGPTTAMKAAVLGRPWTIGFRGATDFVHVADTAAAFVACAKRAPEGALVFNLHGETQDVQRIIEVIDACTPAAGRGQVTSDGPSIPIPPRLDGTAIHERIGDLPVTSLEEGVRSTMERFALLRDAGRLDTRDLDI